MGYATYGGERTDNPFLFSPYDYVKEGDYIYTLQLLSTRTVAAQVDDAWPLQMIDLIRNVQAYDGGYTTLVTGTQGLVVNSLHELGATDLGYDFSHQVKQGGFRDEREGWKNISMFTGILKNIHSTFAPRGAVATDNWYRQTTKEAQDFLGKHITTKKELQKPSTKSTKSKRKKGPGKKGPSKGPGKKGPKS